MVEHDSKRSWRPTTQRLAVFRLSLVPKLSNMNDNVYGAYTWYAVHPWGSCRNIFKQFRDPPSLGHSDSEHDTRYRGPVHPQFRFRPTIAVCDQSCLIRVRLKLLHYLPLQPRLDVSPGQMAGYRASWYRCYSSPLLSLSDLFHPSLPASVRMITDSTRSGWCFKDGPKGSKRQSATKFDFFSHTFTSFGFLYPPLDSPHARGSSIFC